MRSIKDILNTFIKNFADENEFYSQRAKVTEIDTANNTCTVETIEDKSEIYKVQFSSYIGASLGFFLIPALDSTVTIAFYNKDEAYLCKSSILGALKVVFKDESGNEISVLIDENGIVFNGGLLGGLVKIAEMTDRFNDLEALHNALQSDLSGWTPVANDGGAALKTALSGGYLTNSVPNSKIVDFENDKITQ